MFEIIQDISTHLQDEDGKPFFFYYGTKASQNLTKKGVTFPVMYMAAFMPSRGFGSKTGFIEQVYDIEILFAYKTETAWTDEQHWQVIRKATFAAKRFLAKLKAHSGIKNVDPNYTFSEIPHLFDLEVSGTILTCKAIPLDSVKIC